MKANQKIRLGINIDHAATLRQVRGGTTVYPNLLQLCKLCKKAGADQITIHLRSDRRHIQDHDVKLLTQKSPLPINLEIGATAEMLKIALKQKPAWVCFVPEKRQELTTEGGLNVIKSFEKLKKMTTLLKKQKIKVSFFIDPDADQVIASKDAGADAVEFHTGKWVLTKGKAKATEWQRLQKSATMTHDLGLGVHAGHGLDYQHSKKITQMKYLAEVNIGHSLICYAVEEGLLKATRKLQSQLQNKLKSKLKK